MTLYSPAITKLDPGQNALFMLEHFAQSSIYKDLHSVYVKVKEVLEDRFWKYVRQPFTGFSVAERKITGVNKSDYQEELSLSKAMQVQFEVDPGREPVEPRQQ
jgi:hypothetical protein